MPSDNSMTIRELYNLPAKVPKWDCVGIEIELEYDGRFNTEWVHDSPFDVHNDGSLQNGVEVVTRPTPLKEVNQLMGVLGKLLPLSGKLRKSERTSIHVHLNVGHMTFLEALKGACGLWLLEPALFLLCSEDRRNNHFCLGVSDTMLVVDNLYKSLIGSQAFPPRFDQNQYKYSSLNWARIHDLGTLELRIKEGLTDCMEIADWTNLVANTFYSCARSKRSIQELMDEVSGGSAERFVTSLLSDTYLKTIYSQVSPQELTRRMEINTIYLGPLYEVDYSVDLGKIANKKPKKLKAPLINTGPVEDDPFFERDVVNDFDGIDFNGTEEEDGGATFRPAPRAGVPDPVLATTAPRPEFRYQWGTIEDTIERINWTDFGAIRGPATTPAGAANVADDEAPRRAVRRPRG